MRQHLAALFACQALLLAAPPGTPAERQLQDGIRAESLKAHVSFLASDLLEGRDTPSRGLELAAEYIAAQFRRIGLEPAGNGGTYFQQAPFRKVTPRTEGLLVRLENNGEAWQSTGEKISVVGNTAVNLENVPVLKLSVSSDSPALPPKEAVRGKAVIVLFSQLNLAALQTRNALLKLEPAALLTLGAPGPRFRLRPAAAPSPPVPTTVVISDTAFATLANALPEGETAAKLTLHAAAPAEEPVELRNVIAKLPGSDPALRDEYVLLTAHYDHMGISLRGDGDRILNGANDDASGVASVLALAEAFQAGARPKRSIVFLLYFGEEKGLLGSRYYAAHPVFPLRKTVANLNLEHMGRTDDMEGDRKGKINATGFGYTTIGAVLTGAARSVGVEAWRHEKYSDEFFARGDNQALADAGIPAVTLSVTYLFPDYHRPGDHWDKLDYANMQAVLKAVALTASRIADAAEPPKWIETEPNVKKYVQAYQSLHATGN